MILRQTLFACCALFIAGLAHGQGAGDPAYPAKVVRLVVPFGPGSGADVIGRAIGLKLAERWHQPVVIDNRAGAAGNIAAEFVSKAAPDGYTLLLGNIATHGINPVLYRKVPYDPLGDFAPIILIAKTPNVLIVHPAVPVKTVRELIAFAKARPGQLNFGSSGAGSGSHLPAELLKYATGVDIVHVPYKGSGQSLTALLSGEVAMVFTGTLSVLPHIKSGRLRPLAVSSLTRTSVLPDVPTMTEAGVKGYEADLWFGILAPAKTSNAVVKTVNDSVRALLSAGETRQRIVDQGAEIAAGTPDQFAAFIRQEIAKWGKVVKATGLRAD